MSMRDGEPYSESVRHCDAGDFYLTHAIWHNSCGSYQPETGVRRMKSGDVIPNSFNLIERGCPNFDFAESIILRGLRKGWDEYRIARFIEWLWLRRQPHPKFA